MHHHGLLYYCSVTAVCLLLYCLAVIAILWLFASKRLRFDAARERRREIVLHIRPSDLPIFISALTNQAAQVSGQGLHHGNYHN